MPNNFVPAREMEIEKAVDAYLHEKSVVGALSETSVYNRRYELNRFNSFCTSHDVTRVSQIHKNLIIAYLNQLKVQNSTKITILMVLGGFMDYLVDEALVLENIAALIQKPRTYQPDTDHLNTEELKRLFETEAHKAPPKSVDRNLLLLSLFSILCLRVSEVTSLKLTDVRLESQDVWVRRKGGKIARIPLNDHLVELFRKWYAVRMQYKGSDSDFVFISSHGNPLKPRQARYIVGQALKRANIVKRQNGTHLLRHSGASLLSQAGEDPKKIQFLLGHASLATTNRYLHFDEQALQKMIARSPKFI